MMIISEVRESLKRNKISALLLMLQTTALFFLMSMFIASLADLKVKTSNVHALGDLNTFQLSDTLLQDKDLQKAFQDPSFLLKTKEFYNNLEFNLGMKYIYAFAQSAAIKDFTSDEKVKFLTYYEHGMKPHYFDIHGHGPYASVKAIQLNQQAVENYHLTVTSGEMFNDQDFVNDGQNDIVPVLLGAEYKGIYKVGDALEVDYLGGNFHFRVKGFIKDKTLVINSTNPETYLDRYIIMPAQNFILFPRNKEEFSFQQKHYLQLVNGDIFSAENPFTVRTKLESIKASSGFSQTQLIGANSHMYNFVFSALHMNKSLIALLFFAFLAANFIATLIYFSNKIEENKKNYSVHLIAGATLSHIFSYYFAELMFIVLVPLAINVMVYTNFIGVNMLTYGFVVAALFIFIVIFVAGLLFLNLGKLNISMMLKKSE